MPVTCSGKWGAGAALQLHAGFCPWTAVLDLVLSCINKKWKVQLYYIEANALFHIKKRMDFRSSQSSTHQL